MANTKLIEKQTEAGLATLVPLEKSMKDDEKDKDVKPDEKAIESEKEKDEDKEVEKALSDEDLEKALEEYEKAMPEQLKKFKSAKHAKGNKDGESSTEKAIVAVPDLATVVASAVEASYEKAMKSIQEVVSNAVKAQREAVAADALAAQPTELEKAMEKISALEKSVAVLGDAPAGRSTLNAGAPSAVANGLRPRESIMADLRDNGTDSDTRYAVLSNLKAIEKGGIGSPESRAALTAILQTHRIPANVLFEGKGA